MEPSANYQSLGLAATLSYGAVENQEDDSLTRSPERCRAGPELSLTFRLYPADRRGTGFAYRDHW